jgi:hypothetical protein
MKIELQAVTVRDLTDGYEDNDEEGVTGYSGNLDIRPPYQREFIYKDKQRDAVIETVTKNFPLNVMYWAVRNDGGYEIIDGQQRTVSLCQYVAGDFAFKNLYFDNLQTDEQNQILDYKLMVYFCSGTDSERLQWFKTINIVGEKLTDQELRNAVYSGSWVSDAKRYFSKTGCPAYQIGGDYLTGTAIRQQYLETVIEWINGGDVEAYMGVHQHDPTAIDLWNYFQTVIGWVNATFPNYRREMKGLDWGLLYNDHKDEKLGPNDLEEEVASLMADDEVTRKKGIYPYVLNRQDRYLSLRTFSDSQKREVYEQQNGICPVCKEHFEIQEMEADHITPWSQGGKTDSANCQMLCREDNRRKGAI